jgi:hypothetical protein
MSRTFRRMMRMGMWDAPEYWQKILRLYGSSLIAYYPLWENAGTVAYDKSSYKNNGVYQIGSVLNGGISPNMKQSLSIPGVGGVNLYSAGLASLFNGQGGAIALDFRISSIDILTNGATKCLFYLRADAQNYISLTIPPTANVITPIYLAGNTYKSANCYFQNTGYVRALLSYSKANDNATLFLNGAPVWTTSGVGTWVGALSSSYAKIGQIEVNSAFFSGLVSDVIILNRPVTTAEARADANLSLSRPITISYIGDSIADASPGFAYMVSWQYNNGRANRISHAVPGAGVTATASNFATQVTAAALDDADIIIIELGTNDDNAGNMTTLQATVETGINNLQINNPRAKIYYLNVLPKWTDSGGGTLVNKGNIRTAIATACASKGITCWDTYTTPWITAADTADGTHPTAAGHAKIATQVLALLP